MADLFDVSVGGTGFHLTSHIIALAALFIACFAITGYISFRSNSIPDRALKNKDHQGESVRVPILASPVGTTRTDVFEITQPANTQLVSIFQRVTDSFLVTAAQTLNLQVGTTRTGSDLVAQIGYQVATAAGTDIGVPVDDAGNNIGVLPVLDSRSLQTTVERKLYIQLTHSAGAITAANAGEVLFMADFYELPTAPAVAL